MNDKAKFIEINDEQKSKIEDIRMAFSGLYNLIESKCVSSRETSLAMTKLEEAQFWAIKSISREISKKEGN